MMMSCSNATLISFFFLIFFLKPSCCMRNNPIFLCPEIEKQSLLSFKQGLEDPENVMSSWDGELNCCKWKDVVCNNLTGHVHGLHLRGLSGKISSSLLNLKHLIHLDLSQNEFGETIPSFIGSFKKLEYLNLSGAGFHGKIPHTFGNLSNLHTLDLGGFLRFTDVNGSYHILVNLLEAESVEWLSRLSQLEYLNMNYVNMSKASNWAQVVYGIIPRAPVDLVSVPSAHPVERRAEDIVTELQRTHAATAASLQAAADRYKQAADAHRRDVNFEVGDYVWAVLTKDRYPAHEYNKLSSRKIGPLEVVQKINPNAYRLRLPAHIRTSDVFNVKHLVPYVGDTSDGDEAESDSRANRFEGGKSDGDEAALLFLDKHDRLLVDKAQARGI